MTRVAIKIAYLGNDFFGSQRQPDLITAEGSVISDLTTILNCTEEDLAIGFASRTDRGVNALGNVVVFQTEFKDLDDLLRGLNSISKHIFYRSYAIVDESFNPRFADIRLYRYTLPSEGIDLNKARMCANIFLGEHDFIRFCRPDGKTSIMKMDSIIIKEDDDTITIDFSARYYLWNVIRRITAAIAGVANGDYELSDVEDALNGKDITFGLARPDGLTLVDVIYKDLEFTTPERDLYSERVKDLRLDLSLRDQFFSKL